MNGRVVRLDPAAHKVVDALLPWFVNGTLDADERVMVEQHLADCARCREEAEWLKSLYAACATGGATPGASSAFRKLRARLEAPRGRPSIRSPWTRWVIGAQLALIAALGTAWYQTGLHGAADPTASYHTLGAPGAAAPPGALVVVFDPSTSEAEMRRVLRDAGARVVDGPTATNAYVLEVPAALHDRALRILRSERRVALAQELDPKGAQ